jgi:NAD(P)-dependent dehydrogenase (short-subunit alcohol dehydrogenase family)
MTYSRPKTEELIAITGASDGIGAAAARELSKRGCRVLLIGRNEQKLAPIARELGAPYLLADLASLGEVKQLASSLMTEFPNLTQLINNAGGFFGNSRSETVDGFEFTFQVNYLAPFLLTQLLLPALQRDGSTVINTSSGMAGIMGRIDLGNLQLVRGFNPARAYANSKLAQILFTRELKKRFDSTGLAAAALHPGGVATNVANRAAGPIKSFYESKLGRRMMLSPEQGADTLVWLAASKPRADWASGEYYYRRKISKTAKQAYDDQLARELWDVSAELVGPWL